MIFSIHFDRIGYSVYTIKPIIYIKNYMLYFLGQNFQNLT